MPTPKPAKPKADTAAVDPKLLPPAVVTGRELNGLWMPREQQWAYVVVPKSACTTVGQYLYYADHGSFYHADVHELVNGLDRSALVPEIVRERLADIPIFCFSFVRNPYARVVSAFLDKVLDLEQNYRPAFRRHLVANWGIEVQGQVDQIENFRRFMQFVDHQYAAKLAFQQSDKTEPRPRWSTVDIHWLHQTWYMRRARRNVGHVDFIGSVETLNEDLQQLTQHLDPPHAPALEQMPYFGVGPKREAPLAEYFDDETTHIMQKIYGPDFDIFGYSREVGGSQIQMDGFERAKVYADHVARYWAAKKQGTLAGDQLHLNAELN